jgi:hypothetical protein
MIRDRLHKFPPQTLCILPVDSLPKVWYTLTIKRRKEVFHMTKNYVFEDYDTGEPFIVEAENKVKATKIAKQYFKDPHFQCIFSDWEADTYGYDTY